MNDKWVRIFDNWSIDFSFVFQSAIESGPTKIFSREGYLFLMEKSKCDTYNSKLETVFWVLFKFCVLNVLTLKLHC